MTPEQDPGERLRTALARSLEAYTPAPAPVGRVLAAGRARRARHRATVLATVAAVLAAGVTTTLLRLNDGGRPAEPVPTTRQTLSPPPTGPVTALVGQGSLNGSRWSVTMEFYRSAPAGSLDSPHAQGSSLLCRRMVIDGERIDQQGGPWTDCQPVDGAHDTDDAQQTGLAGLHDKGTRGERLLVSTTATAEVSYAVVKAGGVTLTGQVVTVPGTSYHTWAVAIPDGMTISTVDEYDAHQHRVSHDTQWR